MFGCLFSWKIWSYPGANLTNVTTAASSNLTGKFIALLKRIQDKVKEENLDQYVIFLHCITQQEYLHKPVLHLNDVMS